MQHITAIEGMAQQLDDLNQSMSQSQIMTKIVSTLPSSYRHFMTVWDNLAETEKNYDTSNHEVGERATS
jgi:hypothetical protein